MKDRDLLLISLCGLAGLSLMLRRDAAEHREQLRRLQATVDHTHHLAGLAHSHAGKAAFLAERVDRQLFEGGR